jgi:hypothetical protein
MATTIRKRIVIPAVATVAVLTVGGGVAWAAFDEDRALAGDQRDRAERAALAEVGSGRVLDADVDDEGGQRLYELEVVDAAGTEWDVVLDEEFAVVLADKDDARDARDARDAAADDTADDAADDIADDAPVSAADRERVGAAAAAAVPGGKAVDVDRGDRSGVAWEAEVVDAKGRDWNVTLDESLTVLDSVRD